MPGQTIGFSVSLGAGSIDPETTQTDSYGDAQAELTSSEVGVVRVRAEVSGIVLSVWVEFFEMMKVEGLDGA